MPERHHAAQEIGTAQEWAVQCSRSADHDVAATASSEMAAIVAKFFGSQAITARFFEEQSVELLEFIPTARRRKIHFQDAGIGSDAE